MAECYRCGISDENERLFDAVSGKGVVKICRSCADEDNLPLIQPVDLTKPEKTKTVYERLSAMANLNPEEHKRKLIEMERQENIRFGRTRTEKRPETNLKGAVSSNFEKIKPKPRTDLVTNFHWVIMRARRAKKLTQKQLAESIGEQESIVASAEAGTIMNDADTFVRKIESYLGVKLRKEGTEDAAKKEIKEKFEKEGNFDKTTTENLTIGDLKEIKEKKKSEGGLFSFFKKNKNKEEAKPEAKDKDMSDEEVDDILFKE